MKVRSMGMKKILLCWLVLLPVISWGMTCEEGEATLLDLYKKFVQSSPEESVAVAEEMIDVLALCSVNENSGAHFYVELFECRWKYEVFRLCACAVKERRKVVGEVD